jgi:thiamine transporter ThiT
MTIDQIVLWAALLSVAGILGWGVVTMARGGTYNVKNSNRIMRYRIIFQAIALAVILVLMWIRRNNGA